MANPPVLLPPRQPFLPTSLPLQDIGVSCDFGPGRAAEVGKASALTQPGTGRLGLMQIRPGLRGGGGAREPPTPIPRGWIDAGRSQGTHVSFSLGQVPCSPEDSPPQATGWVPQTPTSATVWTAFVRAEPEPEPLQQRVAGIPERWWPLGFQHCGGVASRNIWVSEIKLIRVHPGYPLPPCFN